MAASDNQADHHPAAAGKAGTVIAAAAAGGQQALVCQVPCTQAPDPIRLKTLIYVDAPRHSASVPCTLLQRRFVRQTQVAALRHRRASL